MPKGPCRTCKALESTGNSVVGYCHADPVALKLRNFTVWWCNRYEADPDIIKAEADAEKQRLAELKKIEKEEKASAKAADKAVTDAIDKMAEEMPEGENE